MNKKVLLILIFLSSLTNYEAQNPLAIPPIITGGNYNLILQPGTTQFYPGITTNTLGANGSLLGPTLIMYKDSAVNITVENLIGEETTIHWHGMHVSAINDGGPHTVIDTNAVWNPQFTVLDKAGTYWYHPHLHMQTDKHVSKGIAGLILVRDAEEASLGLPMTYGVDEFPIVMQTKGFDTLGQIEVHTEMDTSVMVNGTVNAVLDLPAQVVRLRVLNGSSQRVYELGFSDNRQFSLIGTDGGLLIAPVNINRYRMAPGQRADVLVDLSADLGQNLQLMNYGSELSNAIYGAVQPGMGAGLTASLVGYSTNPLNGADFQVLDMNVVAQTANPVLSVPAALASYTPLTEGMENVVRSLTFTSTVMGDLSAPFLINNATFDLNVINETVQFNDIEIWTLTNQSPIAHPFHIHDVQFFILDINGTPPPPEMQGLNDVVLVPGGFGEVRFIALFNDHVSDTVPYMYHCHMLTHEDLGMMGQFLVVDASSVEEPLVENNTLKVYPNPSNMGKFTVLFDGDMLYSYQIFNIEGRLISQNNVTKNVFDVNVGSSKGVYFLKIISSTGVLSKMLIVD